MFIFTTPSDLRGFVAFWDYFEQIFDFKLGGAICTIDIAPHDLNRKSAQKNPKIDRTLTL